MDEDSAKVLERILRELQDIKVILQENIDCEEQKSHT
jgi:hypothetical protein